MAMDFLNFFLRKNASKDVAKSRLKFVLVQDRLNCSPKLLEIIKSDILKVISNYMDIDEEGLEIQITQNDDEVGGGLPMLYANIPIKSVKKTGM
jgi:cell division topological specificity factor